jgi:hypothetical protein
VTAPARYELFGFCQGTLAVSGAGGPDVEVGVRQNPAHA